MRQKVQHAIIIGAVAAVIFLAYYGLRVFTPLHYAPTELFAERLVAIASMQEEHGELTPREAALTYLYFGTDYATNAPQRITIKERRINDRLIRIDIYDPSVRDDSVHQKIDRIYLKRDGSRIWKPFKHEWSHKGRGRFGWTTKPTI